MEENKQSNGRVQFPCTGFLLNVNVGESIERPRLAVGKST